MTPSWNQGASVVLKLCLLVVLEVVLVALVVSYSDALFMPYGTNDPRFI